MNRKTVVSSVSLEDVLDSVPYIHEEHDMYLKRAVVCTGEEWYKQISYPLFKKYVLDSEEEESELCVDS